MQARLGHFEPGIVEYRNAVMSLGCHRSQHVTSLSSPFPLAVMRARRPATRR
jgi:hypothetical protein